MVVSCSVGGVHIFYYASVKVDGTLTSPRRQCGLHSLQTGRLGWQLCIVWVSCSVHNMFNYASVEVDGTFTPPRRQCGLHGLQTGRLSRQCFLVTILCWILFHGYILFRGVYDFIMLEQQLFCICSLVYAFRFSDLFSFSK